MFFSSYHTKARISAIQGQKVLMIFFVLFASRISESEDENKEGVKNRL